MSFYLAEVSALKTLDHAYINVIIDRRKLWREVAHQRIGGGVNVKSRQTIVSRRWKEITDDTVEDLHELADILIKTSIDHKFVTSVNHAYVYTNNITLFKRIVKLANIQDIGYSEAVINRPKDTIKLANPKYPYRSYLKSVKLSPKEKENIMFDFDSFYEQL